MHIAIQRVDMIRNNPDIWVEDLELGTKLRITMSVPPIGFGHWGTQYDVSSDGNRVYSLRDNTDPGPRESQVVTGWRARLN